MIEKGRNTRKFYTEMREKLEQARSRIPRYSATNEHRPEARSPLPISNLRPNHNQGNAIIIYNQRSGRTDARVLSPHASSVDPILQLYTPA